MTIMVIGGGGFIGSHICELLGEGGDSVVSFDLVSPLSKLERKPRKLKVHLGDITKISDIRNSVKKFDVDGIITTAAVLPPQDAVDPYRTFQVNVAGLLSILETARVFDLERVIFISTSGVYGKRVSLKPLKESFQTKPVTFYEYTKVAGEQLCENYRKRHNIEVAVLRWAFIYGPRQFANVWPLNILLYHALKNKPIELTSGADYKMEYTYVKDAALASIVAYRASKLSYLIYNVGSGTLVSVRDIITIVKNIFPHFACEIGPGSWPVEMFNDWIRGPLDISRAKFDLRIEPKYNLEEGVKDYLEWLDKHPSEYESWVKSPLWVR